MTKKISYIYFGSSTFSRIILQGLCALGQVPVLVVTKPDKPKGRGLKVFSTEVSDLAKRYSITCLKPISLNDSAFVEELKSRGAEYFIVADYGNIIPTLILDIPVMFSICAHPSILPFYRGASPIECALLNGDSKTGVTIFKINERVDSGDIILKNISSIDDEDDYISLREKLAKLSVTALVKSIININEGNYELIAQDESKATFTQKLTKLSGRISWVKSALNINNLIRATSGWPFAYTNYKGRTLRILSAQVILGGFSQDPGIILEVNKDGISVATGKDILKITKVQPQGKKEMDSWSFVCGYRVKVGDKFTGD